MSQTPYISRIQFLVPSNRVHVFINGVFIAFHAIVAYYMITTIGEPYRNVISELSEEAVRNGSVLMLETLESTEEVPIPGEFAPNPVTVIAMIVTLSLHLLFYLVQRWSVVFRIYLQFKKVSVPSSFACVYPAAFRGAPAIVSLTNKFTFTFQRRKFTVEKETGHCQLLSFPIEQKTSEFLKANSQGITSSAELIERESLYGLNLVDIPVPPFWKLLMEQVLSPIPIFQLFCSALWMMDEYWKYTIFTLLSIFGFEFSTTMQRKKSLETLRSMSGKSVVPVEVFRSGTWSSLMSDHLLPGDRLRLTPNSGTVPCDCLIVSGGSAVVNEASLTGESVPQMKDAIDSDRCEILDIVNRDKVHVLFSGTRLVRLDPDVELIALRTGSESSQGELLRMVEFSQQNMGSDKRDTMYLLLLLLMFALIAAGYVVYERLSEGGSENLKKMNSHKLMLRVIMIITSVVPPELPMQMSLSVNTALMALHKIGVFCTEPFRVPMAGTISRCFFDKTGTLTSDQLECKDIISQTNREMCAIVIAGCHSLIEVDGQLIGDPIEVRALEKIAWKYDASKNESTDGKTRVKILHRFHFSSALQRMSCVVEKGGGKFLSLVKGSPEKIFAQLKETNSVSSEWYWSQYEGLASKGMRVLAFAYKELSTAKVSRETAENGLIFAGFGAFACETRADSALVINAISGSASIPCVMITGDAPLTAIHVAQETGICKLPILILKKNDKYHWESLGKENRRIFSLDANISDFDLVISGEVLPADESHVIWQKLVPQVKVFARMSPQQKERVIALVNAQGGKTLMCGDGGNDVGALKQADVGVALLAGFGALNVTPANVSDDLFEDPEEALEKENRLIGMKEKLLAGKVAAEFAIKKKELMARQQEWMNEELARNGNAYWQAIKTVTTKLREELQKEGKLIQAKYGSQNVWQKKSVQDSVSSVPTVQMGDASVAAPFTSRAPSIRAVIQIVRQGRCTLLVAVQMMQIMMLESLVSAYTMAAITMEGGRSTELQLIGSSVFVMVASIAFTYAKPSKKLSSVIPLQSVFHPSIFLSVFAQVFIHLSVLVFAMSWAKAQMGPDALSDLYAFEREREKKLTQIMVAKETDETGGWMASFTGGADLLAMFKSVPYEPNLLNTVMFLVKTSQQVSVLVVNYKGSPWMQGALENKALFLSMFLCALGIVICSTGYIPELNSMLELMVLPNELRNKLLILLLLSTLGTLIVDRLIVLIFSPAIFFASTWEPMNSTRFSDFIPILKTCGYILAGLVVAPIVLGNPIGLIGGIYAYKKYQKWRSDQDLKELARFEGEDRMK